MSLCECNLTLANKGVPGRQAIASVVKRHILVPMVADDGDENYIDLATATLDKVYFEALFNQADPSKRWFPMPLIDNVSDVRAESKKEVMDSGQNIYVEQGVRSFSGVMVKQSSTMLDKMQNERCVVFGVFEVTKTKQLIGRYDSANNRLYPIAVDKETWDATLVKATDSTTQKIQLMFDYDQTEKDEDLRLLCYEQDLNSYDLLKVNGLLDVTVTAVAGTLATTGVTLTLALDFGSALTKIPVTGWEKTDLALYNVTDSATTTILTMTEDVNVPGKYVLTYAAETVADVIRVSKAAARLWYEIEPITYIIA